MGEEREERPVQPEEGPAPRQPREEDGRMDWAPPEVADLPPLEEIELSR